MFIIMVISSYMLPLNVNVKYTNIERILQLVDYRKQLHRSYIKKFPNDV